MFLIRIVVLSVVIAAGTYFFGWMSVPIAGAVYALGMRTRSASIEAGIAALLGWGVLIARAAAMPSFNTLLDRLGQIFPVPGIAVACLTLAIATLLAWSAARIVSGIFVRT
ncbi:MAG: hypothetical protein ACO1Q7_05900 [Gemmatimonas sp.]